MATAMTGLATLFPSRLALALRLLLLFVGIAIASRAGPIARRRQVRVAGILSQLAHQLGDQTLELLDARISLDERGLQLSNASIPPVHLGA